MNVYNIDTDFTQPFFHISQGTADTSTVQIIKDGYFTVAFIESEDSTKAVEPLPFVVDPTVVYGTDTTLTNPTEFFSSDAAPLAEFVKQPQGTTSRTPCSFAGATASLAPGQSITVTSIYGHAKDIDEFVTKFSPLVRSPGFAAKKRAAANKLVDDITKRVPLRRRPARRCSTLTSNKIS